MNIEENYPVLLFVHFAFKNCKILNFFKNSYFTSYTLSPTLKMNIRLRQQELF